MKKGIGIKSLSWTAVVAVFSLPLLTLPGAVNMFLDIEGNIRGEAEYGDHKDEIEVLAWSWGMSNSGSFHTSTGGEDGKSSFEDISITKYIDISSPVLMLYCANGDHFTKAKLTVLRGLPESSFEYLVIDMNKVLVSSISTGGSGGEDRLTENVTLNFSSVMVTYKEELDTGKVGATRTMTWNIPGGKEGL